MIDFEEELKRFHPSLEVEQVEENVYNNKPRDMADLLQEMIKEMKGSNRYKIVGLKNALCKMWSHFAGSGILQCVRHGY